MPNLCRCECMDKNEVKVHLNFRAVALKNINLYRNLCAKLVHTIDFGILTSANVDAKMKLNVPLACDTIQILAGI